MVRYHNGRGGANLPVVSGHLLSFWAVGGLLELCGTIGDWFEQGILLCLVCRS